MAEDTAATLSGVAPEAQALPAPLVNFFQVVRYNDVAFIRLAAGKGASGCPMQWRSAMIMSITDAHALADLINAQFPPEQKDAE